MLWISLLMIAVVVFFMFLSAVLHAVFLTLFGYMKFLEVWDATVLNKYSYH